MKTVAYGWRMTARAALRWAREAQKQIEGRLTEIENSIDDRHEYQEAKSVWRALRSAEVRIADELNNSK